MLSFVMQDDEKLTREQIQDEIQKIKNAHAEDEGNYLFPDRVVVLLEITSDHFFHLIASRMYSTWVQMLKVIELLLESESAYLSSFFFLSTFLF